MASKSILGIRVPHTADSHQFVQFVELVYKAADSNYLSAGRLLGVSAMMVWNLLHGRQKDSKQIRAHLDILPLTAPAPVCPTHGTVHCWDCETQTVIEKPAETKPPSNRKPQIRLAATVTEEQRGQLRALADCYNMSWSELCQGIAEGDFFFGRYPG